MTLVDSGVALLADYSAYSDYIEIDENIQVDIQSAKMVMDMC